MTSSLSSPATFVLVHGAWHGGWCWSRVAALLRARGHTVYTPTQTGTGERSHLLDPAITLQTFVDDIVNVLRWEDLNNVVLVGHSFGGLSITGAADVCPERIARLVYLDAFLLPGGVTAFDTMPGAMVDKLRSMAMASPTPVPTLPAPKPASFGLTTPDDCAFVANRLTPQPLGVYETALTLDHPTGNGLPCSYIHCSAPAFAAVSDSYEWARQQPGWALETLETGHDAMVSAPGELAQLLDAMAARPSH